MKFDPGPLDRRSFFLSFILYADFVRYISFA